jgi:hypothetical protein
VKVHNDAMVKGRMCRGIGLELRIYDLASRCFEHCDSQAGSGMLWVIMMQNTAANHIMWLSSP